MTPHRPPFPFDASANGRREQVFASDQQPETPPIVIPPDPWADVTAAFNAALSWLGWCVWLAFFAAVLLPVGLVGYGIGSAMRTARETWRRGWADHATREEE